MTHDDPRTLETIAENLDRAAMPFQAEQLRLIAGRVRKSQLTLDEICDEIMRETDAVEEEARARTEAVDAGAAVRLRPARMLVLLDQFREPAEPWA